MAKLPGKTATVSPTVGATSTNSARADLLARIMKPEEIYKGLSYGDWAARWSNWMFSEAPDDSEIQDDVAFLRGNMEYYRFAAKEHDKPIDLSDLFYDRTGDKGILISDEMSVFVPVLTATYFIGGNSEIGTMYTEEQVRHISRKENDLSGGIWATIEGWDPNSKNLSTWCLVSDSTKRAKNLAKYRASSRLFRLMVADKNPFLKDMASEYPIAPGEYDAVVDGFFVLLKNLEKGTYRIRFGGKGRGNYRTDAIYDIHVSDKYRYASTVGDISDGTGMVRGVATWLGGIPKRDQLKSLIPY